MHQKKVGFCGAVFFITPTAHAAQCAAGYYLDNGECVECNPTKRAFYCPGDDIRHPCPTTDTDYEKLSGWEKIKGYENSWASINAASTRSCMSNIYFQDAHGNLVLSECPFNGENYWCNRQLWYVAAPGFYLANYYSTTSRDWYASVRECTNLPENAHYTGPGTPDAPDGSVRDANDCPWECDAGYYGSSANGDTSCADCGSGNYCTGGTHRATCESSIKPGAPTPTRIRSVSSIDWSDLEHCAKANDCVCDWNFSDETRINYLNQGACENGPRGHNYTSYFECRTGYYAADPLDWGDWYTSCKACTNAPENATYTSYSTPSVMYAVESNCPWRCNDGYVLRDGQCLQICPAGITTLKTSNGVSIPLFAQRQTTPALNVGYAGQVCYGNLAPGAAAGALNINVGGQTYHAVN